MNMPDAASGGGKFRLGLIGAGRMGRTHLRALTGSRTVTVAGVVDSHPDARDAVRAAGFPAFETLDALRESAAIDGALIAVPTTFHLAMLEQVAAHGIPVLCEKPCGLNVDEASRCAAAAERAGILLQVAYWRRFVPALADLRRRVLDGELGDILAVNCYQWDEAPPSAQFRGSSGGIFVDMGVHEFDQVRWLTGQEFMKLNVASASTSTTADPDCAQLTAELDGGGTAIVSLGRWHPAGDSCKVEVFGTAGTATSCFLDPVDGGSVFRQALQRQAEQFAATVLAGGKPGANGASVHDAVAALTIATAATEKMLISS